MRKVSGHIDILENLPKIRKFRYFRTFKKKFENFDILENKKKMSFSIF